MASETFTSQIGAAAASTYLTTPVLPASQYPPAAQRVLGEYRRTFGTEGSAYVLYGYEAMALVLHAIKASGDRGNDRQTVIDRVFATSNRKSAIGRYSVEASGETTLSSYGVDRVSGGQPVFFRAINLR
jgi:branched-chain amino acid transport system substrate-binding protein